MPTRSTQAAGAYAVLALTDAALATRSGRAARAARFVTKPLLMPVLSTAFGAATGGDRSRLTRGTAAAHAFSWGGDVAMLGRGDKAFLAGLTSFSGAQVSYVTAFRDRGLRADLLRQPGVRAAAAMLVVTGPAMAIAAARREPGLALPVAGYSTLLATMFASSTTMDPDLSRGTRGAVAAGAALFLASDTILGIREFVLRGEQPALDAAVMATYTAGQALIAAGVARAARERTKQ
jgi:uncharacterized membrane protein YhhN